MNRRLAAAAFAFVFAACAPLPPPSLPSDASSPPSSADGKFYLDDGPPLTEPADLSLADAVVRRERLNPAHNDPYQAFGKTYTPFAELTPYRRRGVASWYGRRYHGKPTASGEIYDMFAMTAAHPILPIPSFARVTAADGKSAIVRVNDRGPFLQGREIDLSYAAAKKLGIVKKGAAPVWVEAIIPPADGAIADGATDNAAAVVASPPPSDAPLIAAVTVQFAPRAEAAEKPPAAAGGEESGDGFYLQIGAFRAAQNAAAFVRRFAARAPRMTAAVVADNARGLHLVRVGPFAARDAALRAAQDLAAAGLDSFVVGGP